MVYENGLLVINFLKYTDSGTYYCMMANELVGLFTLQVLTTQAQVRVMYNKEVLFECKEEFLVKYLVNRTVTITWLAKHADHTDTVGVDSQIRFSPRMPGVLICSISVETSSTLMVWTTFTISIEIDDTVTTCSKYPFACFSFALVPFCCLVCLLALYIHKTDIRNEIVDNLVLDFINDFDLHT